MVELIEANCYHWLNENARQITSDNKLYETLPKVDIIIFQN